MKHLRHWHRSYCDQRQLTFKCNFLPVLFCKKHWCGHYNELIKQYKGCDSYYDWLCLTCTKNDVLAMRWKRQALQFPAEGFFLFARVCKEVVPLIPANCLVMPNKATPTGLILLDRGLCQWMAEEISLLSISAVRLVPRMCKYSRIFRSRRADRVLRDRLAATTTLATFGIKFYSGRVPSVWNKCSVNTE